MTEAEVEAINAEASVLMKRGIAFMEEPRREAAIDALHCFDEALELRRRVPADHSPFQGYLLAACLLNRADALVRINDVGPVAAALASYDEGIEVLRALPLAEDARYPRRLAMALSEPRARAAGPRTGRRRRRRGRVCRRARGAGRRALARHRGPRLPPRRGVAEPRQPPRVARRPRGARRRARRRRARARAASPESKPADPPAAAAGLQARHVLCRVCAHRLSQATGDEMPEDVHEATDAVDDGLALVRSWEQRGGPWFRALAFDLFRFGARVYAHYQPQFLEEFIEDNMNPALSSAGYVESPEMVLAAHEARQLIPREKRD